MPAEKKTTKAEPNLATGNSDIPLLKPGEFAPYSFLPSPREPHTDGDRGLPELPMIHPNSHTPEDLVESIKPGTTWGDIERRIGHLEGIHAELDNESRSSKNLGSQERTDAAIGAAAVQLQIGKLIDYVHSLPYYGIPAVVADSK